MTKHAWKYCHLKKKKKNRIWQKQAAKEKARNPNKCLEIRENQEGFFFIHFVVVIVECWLHYQRKGKHVSNKCQHEMYRKRKMLHFEQPFQLNRCRLHSRNDFVFHSEWQMTHKLSVKHTVQIFFLVIRLNPEWYFRLSRTFGSDWIFIRCHTLLNAEL